jgi:inorganic pyrophosphatase
MKTGSGNTFKNGVITVMLEHEAGFTIAGNYVAAPPLGTIFPFDIGLIPNTMTENGEALKAMVITDESVPAGTMIKARLLGIVTVVKDGLDNALPFRHIIAVATNSTLYQNVERINQLNRQVINGLINFFPGLTGKKLRATALSGKKAAMKLIKRAIQ